MAQHFKTIGLIGKPDHQGANATITTLHQYLIENKYQVLVEKSVASSIAIKNMTICSLTDIGEQADLAIVVGGDGYMLGAARVLACFEIGVIGVNRGNLGFLTDLSPNDIIEPLAQILSGKSRSEFYGLEEFYLRLSIFYVFF